MNTVTGCYYFDGLKPVGPFELTHLITLLSENKVSRETPVWYEGLPDWIPLARILPPNGTVSQDVKRQTGRLYTLNQTGPIRLKEIHVKKSTPRAMMLNDFTVLPDGTRRKVLVRGSDDVPETPLKALEQYIMAQLQRVADAEASLKKESAKLSEALRLQEELKSGKAVPLMQDGVVPAEGAPPPPED